MFLFCLDILLNDFNDLYEKAENDLLYHWGDLSRSLTYIIQFTFLFSFFCVTLTFCCCFCWCDCNSSCKYMHECCIMYIMYIKVFGYMRCKTKQKTFTFSLVCVAFWLLMVSAPIYSILNSSENFSLTATIKTTKNSPNLEFYPIFFKFFFCSEYFIIVIKLIA